MGSYEHGNELLGCIKAQEFLISWTTVRFSRDSAPWSQCWNPRRAMILIVRKFEVMLNFG
jgi:hypothetical protein